MKTHKITKTLLLNNQAHHRSMEQSDSNKSNNNNNNNNNDDSSSISQQLGKECQPIEKCELCTFSDQKSMPVCKVTGRRQKFECILFDNDGEESGKRSEYRSCKSTEADEEFAMIRLQMLWVVVGSMAFLSVRRQKRVSASLFDQRKMAADAERKKRGRRDSNFVGEEEEIEFSQLDEETVPLVETSSNPLEVV